MVWEDFVTVEDQDLDLEFENTAFTRLRCFVVKGIWLSFVDYSVDHLLVLTCVLNPWSVLQHHVCQPYVRFIQPLSLVQQFIFMRNVPYNCNPKK